MHGRQQLSLFHAHYDSRCFLPIHIYEAGSGRPVAVILRPGKTPSGAEVALVLRHVVRAIRSHWPAVDILIRSDSPSARHEAMSWLERNRVGFIFGRAGNQLLLGKVRHLAEDTAVTRTQDPGSKVRRYGAFRHAAKSWHAQRQIIARVEASDQGGDSGAVDRLLVHTAAYWLLHGMRGLAPKTSFWREAQLDTIRLALIKGAGRVTEMATRVKVALPSAYPYQDSLALLAARAAKLLP